MGNSTVRPFPKYLLDAYPNTIDPVLINNAAIATVPEPDISLEHLRKIYDDTFNTNITSIAVLTTALLPLLRHSRDPRVINISSGRASMHAMTTGSLPPTVSVAYSVSKLAMNALMLEFAKQEDEVRPHQGSKILYQAVNPGHCKTSLNGFRGKRDPFEGVKVVEEMVLCQRDKHETGFWMWEGDEERGQLERMIW
jgi:NAD(P)-dependent dehydrogenase (short-subunit alcohol dehydrogenase family)